MKPIVLSSASNHISPTGAQNRPERCLFRPSRVLCFCVAWRLVLESPERTSALWSSRSSNDVARCALPAVRDPTVLSYDEDQFLQTSDVESRWPLHGGACRRARRPVPSGRCSSGQRQLRG